MNEPFSWRGKNIQWVRKHDGLTQKAIEVGEDGIFIIDHITEDFRTITWLLLKEYWQWSEDNATWRKFE